MEATDVEVGFAELLSPTVGAAITNGGAVDIVVAVGAWGSHLMVGGGHICLLKKTNTTPLLYSNLSLSTNGNI